MTDTPKGATVLQIGCKLPNGLILELGKVGDDDYQRHELKGSNSSAIIGGYGITPISAKFWEQWISDPKHKRLPFVTKGLVFAERDVASAEGQAKDFAGKKSGFERLNPNDVAKIAPGAEMDADHFKSARLAAARSGAVG